MKKTDKPQMPGHLTRKDSIACGVVLASILFTMACSAFVIAATPDLSRHYAQASTESNDD